MGQNKKKKKMKCIVQIKIMNIVTKINHSNKKIYIEKYTLHTNVE